MWFPKFPYTNFSQINLDWVLRQVHELSEWMNRYFKDIRQDLDEEINDRIEGDKALNARVDKEISDRTEADTALEKRIDKEITDRTEADNNLQSNIDAEKTAREEADRQLQTNIDAEKTARKEADRQLQANIDAEKTAREEADRQLTQDITQLRADAILKDGSTTTTAAIPFAKGIKVGSISENSMGAGVAIESNLDLNNHTISSVLPGTDEFDAATVGQLDDKFADVHSIPAGGTAGQVLGKIDGTDYNVTWVDQTGGGGEGGNVPAGGTTGQVLAKSTDADYQTEWVNQTEGLPEGGTVGQVVTKTADGAEWAEVSGDSFKLVQSNAHFDVYASDNGFAILVGKKLIKPTTIPSVGGNPDNGYVWGCSFEYTNLRDPNLTINEKYRLHSPYSTTPVYFRTDRTEFGTPYLTNTTVQILTNDCATNFQGYFLNTYRIYNPKNFEMKTLDKIFEIIENTPTYLMYRYK